MLSAWGTPAAPERAPSRARTIGSMSHSPITRSLYALVLIGALVACSAPPRQSQPPSSSTSTGTADEAAEVSGSSTSLGSISGQGSTAPGELASSASSSHPSPAETAAQARVQAAREQASKAQAQAAQAAAEQCRDIATQIRTEQTTERAAPSTSIDEDIVAATLAKADKRIDRLQQQYDSLGCPDSDLPATHERIPQPPRAPGALPP
jgi:hypothetical protein